MVKATRGLLINWYFSYILAFGLIKHTISDESVREILLKMDQSMHFIIESLDTQHLFVDAAQVPAVEAELSRRLKANVYLPPDTVK